RAIASAYGLALSQINGIYMISKGVPDDLAAYRLSGTESFRMRYIRADTASGLLPTFLFQYVHRNSEQNAVVVTAPVQMLEKIRSDLRKVDVAPPMIMIEALAVEVNSTRDLETALGVRLRDMTLEPRADASVPNPTTGGQMDTATGQLTFRQIGKLPDNWEASLRALEVAGKARIHANPRMAAVNGGRASLFIGNQKFIQVQYVQYGNQQTKIQAVDVGVKLDVQPWTGGNGEITTRIEPEVSNIVELDSASGLPVLSSRRARTSVRVKDGETIIIGGLRQKQETLVRRRLPILGSVPLVGALFRSKVAHTAETELVIFITPHVLTEEGHLADDAAESAVRERLLGGE
ncbi:MAG: type II and III secretion system protein, partial [Armatimonadetes bacterium]|nr:type II and III secretion system protein [Armatimonadota bacterium]